MKSAREWRKEMPVNTYVGFMNWLEAIQKDAFDAGRVDAVNGAIYALEQHGFDLAYQFLKLRKEQLTQPKDTPCSKNTP